MSNNKQQTAVEWFANEVLLYKYSTNINGTDYILIPINKIEHLKEQTKKMEKEQMIDFALLFANSNSVYIEYDCEDCPAELTIERPDTLFNEIYGGENEN
jgi:hypothetical protein